MVWTETGLDLSKTRNILTKDLAIVPWDAAKGFFFLFFLNFN